jgi:large subunit ribosomal protein L24
VLEPVYVKDGGEISEEKVKTYRDVIVDKVFMERHTTGIDPFTGTDYGESEIPKEHQYDPKTGFPIFHRYIAGTRESIDWPQEKMEKKDRSLTPEDQEAKESWIKKTLGTIRHPISSFKSWKSQTPNVSNSNQPKVPRQPKVLTEAEKAQRAANRVARRAARKEQIALIESLREEARQARRVVKPRSQKPGDNATFDADTLRNIVGGAESMSYNIVAPPFPDSLGEELRSHIKDLANESRRNQDDTAPVAKRSKRVTEQSLIASELAKAKHAAAQKMKTPMQLRWETEHAKKIKQQKKAPLVSTDELMAALGKHIKQARKQKVSAPAEELD